MRKDRNGLRITGVLIIVCLACLCGAAQGEDANGDGSETDLDVALKFGAFFSYGPDDEVLFPERDSALGLGRVRLTINHRFNRTANAQIAYEHQVQAVSHGATLGLGGGVLPSFADPAYRITPLADEIVDIVDTGNTLRANGLMPWDFIAPISSRLIVNKAALKMKHAAIGDVVEQVSAAVEKRDAAEE